MSLGDVSARSTALGKTSVATAAFRVADQLQLVAVVKATFAIVPGAPMTLLDPEPIVRVDQHRDKTPMSPLVAPSDLVPRRVRADVIVTGYARAPHERPTPAISVRLMIAQGQEVVLDKRLAVRGPPDPTGRTREPSPFAAMQLCWELAAQTPENPVGIPEGPVTWPHVVDPLARTVAGGFAPISASWPSRRQLLSVDEAALAAPIPHFAANFAWGYFNAAPGDQRVPFLNGDEWVAFEGMRTELARVTSRLPGVKGAAKVYSPFEARGGRPVALQADSISIDADRMRCSVVWRGSFPVERAEQIAEIHVCGGVESADHPLVFPISPPAPHGSAPPAPQHWAASTVAIDVSEIRARLGPVTPFEAHDQRRPPSVPPAPPPPAPSVPPVHAASPRPAAHPLGGPTIALSPGSFTPSKPATPFVAMGAPPPNPVPAPAIAPEVTARPAPRMDAGATVAMLAMDAIGPATPFTPAARLPDASPHQPLPPATPFEGAVLVPTVAPTGPGTIDLSRLQVVAAPPQETIGQRVAHGSDAPRPVMTNGAAPSPSLSPPSTPPPADGPPPETLGDFFLAAMARAGHDRATENAAARRAG